MQNSSDTHILGSAGLGFLCSYIKKKKNKPKTSGKKKIPTNPEPQINVKKGIVSVWG